MATGPELLELLKTHILATMSGMPECQPGTGKGAGSRLIEDIADLDLQLEHHNGWLTWSVLHALLAEGRIEVSPTTVKRLRFRLK